MITTKNWKCESCGMVMKLANEVTPALCCSCGSRDVRPPDYAKRLETYRKYDDELESITAELNELHIRKKELHERYTYIMQYFRQQKKRGLISEEEYRLRSDKYIGLIKRRSTERGD